jgi:hypothetical protein
MHDYPIFAFCPNCQRHYGLELMFCRVCHAQDRHGNTVSTRLWISEPIGQSGEFRKSHPPGSLSKEMLASFRKRNGNPKPWGAAQHGRSGLERVHRTPDDDAA